MAPLVPFFRDQGSGVGVVCLHSNASTSAQWRGLSEALANRFRVLAVDAYGAGKSPEWPAERPLRLEDEVALVSTIFRHAGDSFHLVGHSYGAAVALKLATLYPQRVRSLVIYEPTLFHLVVDDDPASSPAGGLWQAATDAAQAIEQGDSHAGAERFIDFWMRPGAWAGMPPARQAAVAGSMRNVGRWRDAAFGETAPASAFAALDVPVLCLWGEDSPESSRSVVRVLSDLLARVSLAPQRGLGHMGPITHPERVNPQIVAFLERN